MKKETITKMENYDVLNKYVEGTSLRELARLTNCSRITIKNYLISVGYQVKSTPQFDLEKAKELYLSGHSCREIASIVNANEDTICMYLKNEGINTSNSSTFRFNENIFDCIDTEEKAYWLGFIYADGSIFSNSYKFELSLCGKDIEHLHKFNKFMEHKKDNVKTRIEKGKFPACRWDIVNKHLWEQLNALGCVPQKTLVLTFPNECLFANANLIRHFIRGYWDGDGCITLTEKTKAIAVLGTKAFLSKLNQYLPEKLLMIDVKNKNIHELRTSSMKRIRSVLQYLYTDSTIYLDRKYQKYLEYCRLWEESHKLQEGKIGELCDENTEVSSEIAQGSETP